MEVWGSRDLQGEPSDRDPPRVHRKLAQHGAAGIIAGNACVLPEKHEQVGRILGIRSGSRPRLGYANDARGIQESRGAEGLGDDDKP